MPSRNTDEGGIQISEAMSGLILADAIQASPAGIRVALDVVPGAKVPAFPAGFDPWRGRIGLRVTEPAQNGRANAAVVALVARFFRLSPADVRVVSGARSAQKTVQVGGISLEAAYALVEAAL